MHACVLDLYDATTCTCTLIRFYYININLISNITWMLEDYMYWFCACFQRLSIAQPQYINLSQIRRLVTRLNSHQRRKKHVTYIASLMLCSVHYK